MALATLLGACGGGGGDGAATGSGTSVSKVPSISGFEPSSAPPGATITIAGSNFSTTASANAVKFNGVAAPVAAATATSLKVTLPSGATTGNVTVQATDGSTTSLEQFIVLAPLPSITKFYPPYAAPGSIVTITGSGFGGAPAENTVWFNGAPAEVATASATSLTVTVPLGASTGSLALRTPGGEATATGSFTVNPTVTGFSPTSGAPGDVVTITGINFGATDGVAFWNGIGAQVTSRSSTALTAVVPETGSTGRISVTSQNSVSEISVQSASTFVVNKGPKIDRFVPAFGLPGSAVTIYGKRFASTAAGNTVQIGGATAVVALVSVFGLGEGYIRVIVPATANTGYITVTTTNGSGISAEQFGTTATAPPAANRLLALSPDPLLDFGTQTIGSYRFERVTVRNVGSASLQIRGAAVAGTNFDFRGTNCYGYNYQLEFFDTLASGASCYVEVGFNSTVAGTSTGAVSVTSTAIGGTYSVGLSGNGTAPLTPAITLAPKSLSFASQEMGTVSAAQAIRLTNSGTAPLTVQGIGVTGDFARTHNCPSSLPAGGACTINVTFAPAGPAGPRRGDLAFVTNAPSGLMGISASAPLLGTGTLSKSGQLAIYTRESWGIDGVYLDGFWVSGGLSPTGQNLCGGQGAITLTVAPGQHTISAYDAVLSIADAAVTVTEGACTVHRVVGTSTCLSPQIISNGVCTDRTPLTCVQPAVLQNGVCVVPGTTPGGSVGTGGSLSAGAGAYAGKFINSDGGTSSPQCLSFGLLKGSSEPYDSQTITNKCSFKVYVMRCHTPSTRAGTADTQCNATGSGRFYQQFGWLEPGEVKSNFYSLPPGTTIWYGACSGGNLPSGKEVSLTGDYTCR
ncbi:MAG: choice-of-anchor D domain-containing protein [Rubrivivax sp.]|nr:choice-of-anchor D domain-containing protein [Rubrivivax sp.]